MNFTCAIINIVRRYGPIDAGAVKAALEEEYDISASMSAVRKKLKEIYRDLDGMDRMQLKHNGLGCRWHWAYFEKEDFTWKNRKD